jgi:hypothetical protein
VNTRADILALRAAGMGWHRIAQHLNDSGVPTPSGRGQWWAASVKHYAHPPAWATWMRNYRTQPEPQP